jgi:putative membrane protein
VTIELKSSNELADERTQLAVVRTIVALDRTLMAWVRTATSLISFGFTIYKFFQQLQQERASTVHHLLGPRGVAMVMIGVAVFGLTLATWQHRRETRKLHQRYAQYGPFDRSLTAGLALTISSLGLIGFVLVVFHQ